MQGSDRLSANDGSPNEALYVYQSLLARTLCKLWFLINEDGTNKNALIEKNFNCFVKEEIGGLFLYEEILSVAHFFYHNTRKGKESSMAIPMTSAMWQLRDEQMKIAQENVEEANVELKLALNIFKYLKQTGKNMRDYGPSRTRGQNCLFMSKICHHNENQVRPVCSPKDKIWSQTDKLQRCRRLPLEQAKLRQILENNSECVLIRK